MKTEINRLHKVLIGKFIFPLLISISFVMCFYFATVTLAQTNEEPYQVKVVYHYINNLPASYDESLININGGLPGTFNDSDLTYTHDQEVNVVVASSDLFPVASGDMTAEIESFLTSYKIDLIENPFNNIPEVANGLSNGYANSLTNWVYGNDTFAYTNWSYAIGDEARNDGEDYWNPNGDKANPNYYVPTGEYVLSLKEVEQLKKDGTVTIHFYGFYGKTIYISDTGSTANDGLTPSTPVKPTHTTSRQFLNITQFTEGDIFCNSMSLVGNIALTAASSSGLPVLSAGKANSTFGFTITSIKNGDNRYQMNFKERGIALTNSETATNSPGTDMRFTYLTLTSNASGNHVTPIIFGYQNYLFIDAGVGTIGAGNLTKETFATQTGIGSGWIGLFGSREKGMRIESGAFRRINATLGANLGSGRAATVNIGSSDASNPVVLTSEVTGGSNAGNTDYGNIVIDGYIAGAGAFGGALAGNMNYDVTIEVKERSVIAFGDFTNGKRTAVRGIYGGSRAKNILGNVYLNIGNNVLSLSNIYAGSNEGDISKNVYLNISNARVLGNVYGGGYGTGSVSTKVGQTSSVNIENSYIKGDLYGGGQGTQASITGSSSIIVSNTIIKGTTYGGGDSGKINGNTSISFSKVNSTNIFGGGNLAAVGGNSRINLTNESITTGNIYGGGNAATVGTASASPGTSITVDNSDVTGSIFGGGYGIAATVTGTTTVNINNNTSVTGSIFGGGSSATTLGNANISISGSSNISNNIYGGGDQALTGSISVPVKINITVDDSNINGNIYGGGNTLESVANTNITINNSNISKSIYGGGDAGLVTGTSTISLSGTSTVEETVYGGGNAADITKNSKITISGTPTIKGNVYGGGNEGNLGISSMPTASNTTINIVGGKIKGNVFGGGRTSVVYGNTILNIGEKAVNDNSLESGNILIEGSIFGGGDVTLEGEDFNFDFISVKNGVNIVIDALNHNEFGIEGSLFGAGNASSVEGTSNMTIKNLGNIDNSKLLTSIQRTNNLTIDNSTMELVGVPDRTNKYSKSLFTLSRIDSITIQNGTTLFLQNGSNLVKGWTSKDGANLSTIATNNKVYLAQGKNLSIATTEDVTSYGEVQGITFLGMYDITTNTYGIYDPNLNSGDTAPENISSGVYVLGLHVNNYQTNGFVTNFEDSGIIVLDYIKPKPDNLAYHLWQVGEEYYAYDISLTASKYSVLGKYYNLSLPISLANTTYIIDSIDTSNLENGIELLNPNSILDHYSNEDDANSKIGIIMKTGNIGWTTDEKVYFLDNSYVGNNTLITENTEINTNLEFYVVNARNISEEKPYGYITVVLKGGGTNNDGEYIPRTIMINISIDSAVYTDLEYEAHISPGYKFESFGTTTTTITNESSFSTFFAAAAYSLSNPYQGTYSRTLTTTVAFPEGTKITMLDISSSLTPDIYYYIVKNTDAGRLVYNLTEFTKMGTIDLYYNNTKNYYNSSTGLAKEEFIFIVDYKDSVIKPINQIDSELTLKLEESTNSYKIDINPTSKDKLKYTVYQGNSDYQIKGTTDRSEMYTNDEFDLTISTIIGNGSINGQTIFDTTNQFNSQLVYITIESLLGAQLNGSDLFGTYIVLDGMKYFPDNNGMFTIEIASKVISVKKSFTITIGGLGLSQGNYKLVLTLPLGNIKDEIEFAVNPLDYGLTVETNNSLLVDKDTPTDLIFTIKYLDTYGSITNPNIRVTLYKNTIDDIILDNLTNITSTLLTKSGNPNEYMVTTSPGASNQFSIKTLSGLSKSGYRFVFSLYDDNVYIGDVSQSIVIK